MCLVGSLLFDGGLGKVVVKEDRMGWSLRRLGWERRMGWGRGRKKERGEGSVRVKTTDDVNRASITQR